MGKGIGVVGVLLVAVIVVGMVAKPEGRVADPMASGAERPSASAEAGTVIRPVPREPRFAVLERMAHATSFGWFDAIHRDDLDLLRTVVGSQEMFTAGVEAMEGDLVRFTRTPTSELVVLGVDRVLLDRPDCVVLEVTDELGGFIDARHPSRTVIVVYWPEGEDRLRMATQWDVGTPASVWQTDCDLRIRGIAG